MNCTLGVTLCERSYIRCDCLRERSYIRCDCLCERSYIRCDCVRDLILGVTVCVRDLTLGVTVCVRDLTLYVTVCVRDLTLRVTVCVRDLCIVNQTTAEQNGIRSLCSNVRLTQGCTTSVATSAAQKPSVSICVFRQTTVARTAYAVY